MVNRRSMLTVCGAAVFAVVMMGSVEAWENARHTNYLTFNTPFALPGVSLMAGTYIFELADPDVSDVVRVLSRDRSQVYLTAFTHTIELTRGSRRPNRPVSFGEVPKGTTPPVRAWYPVGGSVAHQFIYPGNSPQLAGRAGN